jgi:integrase
VEDAFNVSWNVSPEVSPNVSSEGAASGAPGSAGKPARLNSGRATTAGKYLVRSGSVYLFQIRMPEDICGRGARIIRVGLGALTARQARAQAELLAALARNRFEQARIERLNDDASSPANEDGLMFGGETPQLTAAEVKGYLKAMHAIISRPAPPTPPHQVPAFKGLRDLVMLNRELAKGDAGSPLITDNAELLKATAFERVNKTLDILSEAGSLGASPKASAQEALEADSRTEAEARARPDLPPQAQTDLDNQRHDAAGLLPPLATSPSLTTVAHDAEPTPQPLGLSKPAVISSALEEASAPGGAEPAAGAVSPFVTPASSEPAAPGSSSRIYRDESGKIIPGHQLDRRTVQRKASNLPRLSEVAVEYFSVRAIKVGENNKDIKTARNRLKLFIELIGDHPVDTYTGTDLQAYIALMTHWPALARHRPPHMSAWEILARNADLKFKPLKRSVFENGYVSIAKTVIGSQTTAYDYENPLAGVRLRYPDTAAPAQAAEPLSKKQMNDIFRAGVDRGLLDEVLLPLLGNLTGRRLGLLVHLTGNDIREKYSGVWVAQTSGIVLSESGPWKRVPIKTDQSTTFFVLHDFLREIGFIDWAQRQGSSFLFPALLRHKDPSKQASTYMQRLFERAGIDGQRREVFHSLRGGHIEMMRDNKIDPRDRRLQAGHKLEEEHDLYGFKSIGEKRARELAFATLDEEVDYSMFQGLDFERLQRARRTRGRRPKSAGR